MAKVPFPHIGGIGIVPTLKLEAEADFSKCDETFPFCKRKRVTTWEKLPPFKVHDEAMGEGRAE